MPRAIRIAHISPGSYEDGSVAEYTVNPDAVAHAEKLIRNRQYVLDSDWGEVQPRADAENDYLERHTWEQYAAWHLGLTVGANDETKARYAFGYGDLRRMLGSFSDLENLRARDILTPQPATIDVDDFAAEALARMQQRNITQLVVTEEGAFAGFIHLHDLLREGLV